MPSMQPRKKRRRPYAVPIGGLFIALALVGVIAVVITSIDLTGKVLDNTSEKEKIHSLIFPVVMFDPVPFENPNDLEPYQLLLFSMWLNLGNSEKRNSYSYNETWEMVVPASDLDVAAARLFGSNVVLEHQDFSDYQTTYYYDAERGIYNVPQGAQLYVYTPSIGDITRADKDLYNVTVGYLPPQGDAWTTDFSGNLSEPEPEKQMIYVLQRDRGEYHIAALRDAPTDTPVELPVLENGQTDHQESTQASDAHLEDEEPSVDEEIVEESSAQEEASQQEESSDSESSDSDEGNNESSEEEDVADN